MCMRRHEHDGHATCMPVSVRGGQLLLILKLNLVEEESPHMAGYYSQAPAQPQREPMGAGPRRVG